MSIFLSPNLAIEQIKRNNFVNNSTQLNNEFSQKIPNNNFLPSFDFYTDIKFLTNSNASNFFQSSSNPFGLSKLSMDKYKNLKINSPSLAEKRRNFENEEKQNNINNNINNKDLNKENNNDELKNDSKNKDIKYKKINNKKNPIIINKNKSDEIKKREENKEKENSNNHLKISSILNDTIGEKTNVPNNKNNSKLNNKEDLLDYLKKENDTLKMSNERNNQIINSLFYFINQLSQKYSPDKKIFDLSFYYSNINCLPSDLNNLNEFIENQNKIKENNINISNITPSKKEEKSKSKERKKTIEKNKRKNNDNFIFDRTFTFGQNDSFNKIKNKRNVSKKQNNIKKINKDNYPIKKINNSKSKKKNNIKVLGCNISGNESSIKNSSKINFKNENFSYIPNEKDAINSIKNILYE
jgi:hypothetical protein